MACPEHRSRSLLRREHACDRDGGEARIVILVGDDWAEDHHDIEVLDEQGATLARHQQERKALA
jgi:hypothetical protein